MPVQKPRPWDALSKDTGSIPVSLKKKNVTLTDTGNGVPLSLSNTENMLQLKKVT